MNPPSQSIAPTSRFNVSDLKGIFTIPSGIITISAEVIHYFSEHIDSLGVITTKSIGVTPRTGNREPVLCNYRSGKTFCNSVGLSNPGYIEWKREISKYYPLKKHTFLLTSIFASLIPDFELLVEELDCVTDGFELNLSCPHAKGYGSEIGKDIQLVEDIVTSIRSRTEKPILLKVSPNWEHFTDWVEAAAQLPIDGLVAINTLGPFLVEEPHSKEPILTNKKGGMSGFHLFPYALKALRIIRSITDLPVIAMGGVSSLSDIRLLKKEGADVIGIGSALAMMSTQQIVQLFSDIAHQWHDPFHGNDVRSGQDEPKQRSFFIPTGKRLSYESATILVKEYYPNGFYLITLDAKLESDPGQYVFLWYPGIGEKPYSIMLSNPLTFIIKPVGEHSQFLSRLSPGHTLYFRGALGNSFPAGSPKPVYLIGGGTGIAPLIHVATKIPYKDFLVGTSSNQQEIPIGRFKNHFPALSTHQSDPFDSAGNNLPRDAASWHWIPDSATQKGFILQECLNRLQSKQWDAQGVFFLCGPTVMMQQFVVLTQNLIERSNIFCCLESHTKCGVGICGSCSLGMGLRSCVDGPIFGADVLSALDGWQTTTKI